MNNIHYIGADVHSNNIEIAVRYRGEIAQRIIRACRELDIETVAIFSAADRGASYLELADEAYCVGPPRASDSYLKISRVISAAEVGNVQAIHPGYGFLSENAAFAQACGAQGVVFIGPPAPAIEAMGSKSAATDTTRIAVERSAAYSRGLTMAYDDTMRARRIEDVAGACYDVVSGVSRS